MGKGGNASTEVASASAAATAPTPASTNLPKRPIRGENVYGPYVKMTMTPWKNTRDEGISGFIQRLLKGCGLNHFEQGRHHFGQGRHEEGHVGMADDLPLQEWLEEHIWPTEAKHVDRQFVYDGTLLAAAEMLKSGTTYFNDMYFFPDATLQCARDAGFRMIVG